MYHTLGYFLSNTGAAANTDIPAINDGGTITIRNNHFIFTAPFEIPLISGWGAGLTAEQLFCPTWNAINIPQIYPTNLAIVPGSNPNQMDIRDYPLAIPLNEEIAVQATNGSGGTDPEYAVLHIRPPGGPPMGPSAPASPLGNLGRILAQFTWTGALTAGVWSATNAITLSNTIKGGTYCVRGLYIVVAHALAYRVNFVRAPYYRGIKLLPGGLVENAYGNVPAKIGINPLGPLGFFNTFELPSLQILGTTTTGSATYTGYLDLTYMGQDMTVDQAIGQISA
jgi:hypothetical protein